MNTLFSSQELLEMELSMLPKSKQGIDYRAKSGQWAFEYVAGKGRGGKVKKYLFSSLPPAVQQAILQKQTAELLSQARQPESTFPAPKEAQLPLLLEDNTSALNALTQKQKSCAAARCAIVQDILHTGNSLSLSRKRAVAYFLEQLHAGTLPERLPPPLPSWSVRLLRKTGCRGL